jgi:hypothetical protein
MAVFINNIFIPDIVNEKFIPIFISYIGLMEN